MSEDGKIVLRVTIHDTPAALRYGGDGYMVTFAGTEFDKLEALKLPILNGRALRITVEEDNGREEDAHEEAKPELEGRGKPSRARQTWP